MADPRQRIGITRRRAVTILAAFAGLPLSEAIGRAAVPHAGGIAFADGIATWRGQALGAPAELILHHPDEAAARHVIGRIVAEVARLEGIFSLYRDTSTLAELNRAGVLAAPPSELVDLLYRCGEFHATTDGAFDPTVQPLWRLYGRHFAAVPADANGPSPADIAAARALTGFDKVRVNRDRIAFARPGMALTLNGIAQGFITDRAVAVMRQAGLTASLVDMGEIRATGPRRDGSPWRIGLASAGDGQPDRIIDLIDSAVATSSTAGFAFDARGRFGHLLDPRDGSAATRYARMSVFAPDATTADALSTAFSLMEPGRVRALAAARPSVAADFTLAS